MRKKRILRTKIHVALFGTKIPIEEAKDYCAPKALRIESYHIDNFNLLIDFIERSNETDLSDAAKQWKIHQF